MKNLTRLIMILVPKVPDLMKFWKNVWSMQRISSLFQSREACCVHLLVWYLRCGCHRNSSYQLWNEWKMNCCVCTDFLCFFAFQSFGFTYQPSAFPARYFALISDYLAVGKGTIFNLEQNDLYFPWNPTEESYLRKQEVNICAMHNCGTLMTNSPKSMRNEYFDCIMQHC